ncbi:zinc metalloproteinase aureolysin [Parasponia andersonii]|uniref:Zinc metalloproteinase aureolysin n=1 Tax=Parasponia andersonii TaxID=3476 RepID=A0A2P5C840_PARAD|nr:zinc metalloproteinase aureolysin [Parasponia andersonii]
MRTPYSGLGNLVPFSKLFRQLEQEMETVVKVLQPGPLGIIEHKFSADEIREASATVHRAVENWRQNEKLEQRTRILNDYIQK